ncbi:TlpA family protein disulfide reductase [Methylomonas methanica]|uniref:Redoxin n=1 Tax=Methylomonas methanica TaxID=421 RepID=A0A177MUZ6_METMH|nr:TlpA disulfide reductase family protein [Methylomonas methanica]OAI08860.1 redoxin [Methylomonas methanica]
MNKALFFFPLLLLGSFSTTAVELGQPAPACPAVFSETKLSVDPSNFKGKVVLLDFWATWCPPCIKSMPFFNGLHQELGKDGFEVVAINLDEDRDTVSQFLTEHQVNYPIAFDPQGECPKIYDVKAMPSSYLLDKSGIVRKIHLGFREGDQALLREQIKSLLNP